MAEFVFTSPGVKFRERDLTFITRNLGITNLGIVGETLKGPAFEPIFVEDKGEFMDRFGRQSTLRFSDGNLKYPLPYAANAYLEESNQLWVTRVLGLSGYDAGKSWAILLEAGPDLDTEDSTVIGATTAITVEDTTSYDGITFHEIGDTGTTSSGYTKFLSTNTFEEVRYEYEVIGLTDTTMTLEQTPVTYSAKTLQDYEGMVLATIRAKGNVEDVPDGDPITSFPVTAITVNSMTSTTTAPGDMFAEFEIIVGLTDAPQQRYVVSLDPNSSEYITKVIGGTPTEKDTPIWVEHIYPDLIKKLDADGSGYGLYDGLAKFETDGFTDYTARYQTPETPWVVSQLRGDSVDRLFKLVSISDGNSANREVKISVTNIDPETGEFNILIRQFGDTDANPVVLESYSRCSMNENLTNYVGRRIGTTDGQYELRSDYIMLEMAENIEPNAFPAGFEGYWLNKYEDDAIDDITEPKIMYKTEYDQRERVNRTYLGISASAYNGMGLIGTGINQNFFNFNGWRNEGNVNVDEFVKSEGFHMDSGVTIISGMTTFIAGADKFRTATDVNQPTNAYSEEATRKFTLVPAGGFDGWNVHRDLRSNRDEFRQGGTLDGVEESNTPTNDFQAWETGVDTFANPEEVTINLFATPGLNWVDQTLLVQDTIQMIEEERTDSLYVIDAPDIDIELRVGEGKADVLAAKEIIETLDIVGLDSSHACTYFPQIQIRDFQNNINLYVPPTGEVLKAMAFTDNTKFPWFAPAGLQRGVTDALKSKYKLSPEARGIIYSGRINPIADFANSGTAIFGQKTLQVKESALDRINVRRLLLRVKVLISNIAIRLVFEQNDQTTIDDFLSKTTPILDTIRREQGLQDFQIKMDDTLNTPETMDRNELYGEIFLKPTRAVEFIGITFTITPSGAAFSEL